jgi:LuxR family transcriptional regulator, maltose regulon positive regulatory protein
MPSQVTGWMLAAQARAGMSGQARALLATVDNERANSGEIHNVGAVICLAEDGPAGVLGAVQHLLDGTAPVIGCVSVVEANLLVQHPPGTQSG